MDGSPCAGKQGQATAQENVPQGSGVAGRTVGSIEYMGTGVVETGE